jgi:hypothetical protein
LQGFEFAERAMEAALDAGLVAGETVELGGQFRVVEDVEVAPGRRRLASPPYRGYG